MFLPGVPVTWLLPSPGPQEHQHYAFEYDSGDEGERKDRRPRLQSFCESLGRGRPQEAPAPSTSLPPCTHGGGGAHVLRRLQNLQKTLRSFPSTGRTGDFSVLLEPHNPVCAQETVTLNSLRGGPAVKILLRGPRVPSAPHPILSPAPPDPAPHPHPGRTASAFPYHSENRSQLQSGGREKVTSIQLPKRPFMVPGVLRTSTPKDMRWGFFCVC